MSSKIIFLVLCGLVAMTLAMPMEDRVISELYQSEFTFQNSFAIWFTKQVVHKLRHGLRGIL